MKDYRDNLTIGEIADNDALMFRDLWEKDCRKRIFSGTQRYPECNTFIGDCIIKALLQLGVKEAEALKPIEVAKEIVKRKNLELEDKNVQVERRIHYDEKQEDWRKGIYIYKNGELAFFVSTPRLEVSPFSLSLFPELTVRTNVKC